jgi:hypothetical protein
MGLNGRGVDGKRVKMGDIERMEEKEMMHCYDPRAILSLWPCWGCPTME